MVITADLSFCRMGVTQIQKAIHVRWILLPLSRFNQKDDGAAAAGCSEGQSDALWVSFYSLWSTFG